MASSMTMNNGVDVVWTNPSPNESFASQTLSLDLSKYKAVIVACVEYAADANRRIINTEFCKKSDTSRVTCGYFAPSGGSAATFSSRPVYPTDTSVIFGNAVNNGGVNNLQCVPVVIYGIK